MTRRSSIAVVRVVGVASACVALQLLVPLNADWVGRVRYPLALVAATLLYAAVITRLVPRS